MKILRDPWCLKDRSPPFQTKTFLTERRQMFLEQQIDFLIHNFSSFSFDHRKDYEQNNTAD